MGFTKEEEKKVTMPRSIDKMTLHDIDMILDGYANTARFNAVGAGERTSQNLNYIAFWAALSATEFRAKCIKAHTQSKSVMKFSGAVTEDGSIRMPVNDSDNYLSPVLYDIIKLQKARLSRIDFAKQQEAVQWDMHANPDRHAQT